VRIRTSSFHPSRRARSRRRAPCGRGSGAGARRASGCGLSRPGGAHARRGRGAHAGGQGAGRSRPRGAPGHRRLADRRAGAAGRLVARCSLAGDMGGANAPATGRLPHRKEPRAARGIRACRIVAGPRVRRGRLDRIGRKGIAPAAGDLRVRAGGFGRDRAGRRARASGRFSLRAKHGQRPKAMGSGAARALQGGVNGGRQRGVVKPA